MVSKEYQVSPNFIESSQRQLFAISFIPYDCTPIASILYIPPFAEEMHKSRKMVAEQARLLASQGYMVTLIDLTGCGDSSGDFSDASWQIWQEDIENAYQWLCKQTNSPIILWGLRTGALLATDLAAIYSDIKQLIVWQPVLSGKQFLNEFLRIKLADSMLSNASNAINREDLLDTLKTSGSIEIGGYELSNTMATQIQQINLLDFKPKCSVVWFELGIEDSTSVCSSSDIVTTHWNKSGITLFTRTLKCRHFWNSQEIITCPELITATQKAINP
jgi:exosortase A-associated hydrolase 2